MLAAITRALVPPFRPEKTPSRSVAIVVPLSPRPGLTADERVSLRHLNHYLGDYDKYLIASEGFAPDLPGFQVKHFARKYFGSAAAHGRMLAQAAFYREFADYEFVFFYHLDSLAFSDQMAVWCATDLDYIGPPWMHCEESLWVDTPRVGNGGFTLLRVASALQVLANRHRKEPSTYWIDQFTQHAPGGLVRGLEWIQARCPGMHLLNRLLHEWHAMEDPAEHGRNNDLFWSDKAVRYLPEFKVASLEQGLRFAFEAVPRDCFEMTGGRMPFGCHAWGRYDREFWLPHLLPEDHVEHHSTPL
ncbi:MAG: DUF5672 family protein [Verrucomicrobiota bacterium]